MQAALLPDRGVVKVAGDDARRFLNGLATTDLNKRAPAKALLAALLTPHGKIIVDFIAAEARERSPMAANRPPRMPRSRSPSPS